MLIDSRASTHFLFETEQETGKTFIEREREREYIERARGQREQGRPREKDKQERV